MHLTPLCQDNQSDEHRNERVHIIERDQLADLPSKPLQGNGNAPNPRRPKHTKDGSIGRTSSTNGDLLINECQESSNRQYRQARDDEIRPGADAGPGARLLHHPRDTEQYGGQKTTDQQRQRRVFQQPCP